MVSPAMKFAVAVNVAGYLATIGLLTTVVVHIASNGRLGGT